MSWTSPRTWVAGETVTAALLNTYVRDNLLHLYTAEDVSASWVKSSTCGTATLKKVKLGSFTLISGLITATVADGGGFRQTVSGLPTPAQSYTTIPIAIRTSAGVRTLYSLSEDAGNWFVVPTGGSATVGHVAAIAIGDSIHINAMYRTT